MNKNILLACLGSIFSMFVVRSQNVFNPNDSVIRWNSSQPYGSAQNPRSSTNGLQKWVSVETDGISFGYSAFDASSFKSYFLRIAGKSVTFRLKYPKSYLNSDSAGKKYPVMLFFHGAGEPACVQNGGIYNNEKHLLHGADYFKTNADNNAFDGFLLYPQIYTTNGGCWASSWSTDHYFPLIINILDSLAKYARADIDRVVADGLSSGGVAAWKIAELYPQRIAATAPTSAVGGSGTNYSKFVHIPVWLATGSVDNNPSTSTAATAVNSLKNLGGSIIHTIYEGQGHFVWNFHWREQGFFEFLSQAHKANPLIYFQKSAFCPHSAIDAKLGITPGFYMYEWQRDGITIAVSEYSTYTINDSSSVSSFTGNVINVKALGTYRVRFKRTISSDWSGWSISPAQITIKSVTQSPNIQLAALSSKVLPALNGDSTVLLKIPDGFSNYQWMRIADSTIVATTSTFGAAPGEYAARYSEVFGCGSNFSAVYRVVSANDSLPPDPATGLSATTITTSSIQLGWKNNSSPQRNEHAFEIYRALSPGGPYQLIAINPADSLSYKDENLKANTVYYYRVRAVNDSGANVIQNESVAKTFVDNIAPTRPMNLQFGGGSKNSVFLRWSKSFDNVKVAYYSVYVNGEKLFSSTDTSFTVAYLDSLNSYTFAVTASDESGNISPLSNQISGFTQRQGLNYKYYHGNWNSLPDFNSLTPVKAGITETISLNSGIKTQSDNFGFLWEGYIYIPEDGTYTFETSSDDGSRLYIDTNYSYSVPPLVNNDGLHGTASVSNSISLIKGYHKIAVSFFEKGGNEVMQVYWSKSGGHSREIIPASFFSLESYVLPIAPATPDSVAPSIPSHVEYRGSTLNSISIGWQPSTDNMQLKQYDIYVNGIKRDSSVQSSFIISGLDSNAQYSIAVRAMDEAGNQSSFSNQLTAITHNQGITYKYYNGSWSALPNFLELTPDSTGIADTVSIDAGVRTQDDNFAFLWEGYIYIPEDGTYTFETSSDDGSKLYLSMYSDTAIALVDNDGLHGNQSRYGSTALLKGYYPIAIGFFEAGGDDIMDIFWTVPNGTRERIPKNFFSRTVYNFLPAPAAPDSIMTVASTYNRVDLSWIDRSTNETGFEVMRSISDTANFLPVIRTPQDVSFYSDSSASPQTKYYYKVRAVGLSGESSFISDSSVTPAVPALLHSPYNVNASLHHNTQVTISWDHLSTTENGFILWRSLPGDSTIFEAIDSSLAGTNAILDTLPSNGLFKYFLVSKNDSIVSNPSDSASVFAGNIAPLIALTTTNVYLKTDSVVTLNFSVSDINGDSIVVELKEQSRFTQLLRIGASTYRLRFTPSYSDIGWYALKIKAGDARGAFAEKILMISVNDKRTRSVFVRFGHSSIPAPKPWNNFTGAITANSIRNSLKDEKNLATTFSMKMVDAWASLTGLGFHTGNNSGAFPDTILARGIRDPAATRKIIIGGLNPLKQYNLVFMGCVNEGSYAANSYAVGNQKDTLIIRYNANETGNLNNLFPDSLGQLTVNINRLPGTPFIYLNAIIIEEYESAVTMLNPANLYAEPMNTNTIHLSWSDRTQFENTADGYELARATDSVFSDNVQLFVLPRNNTAYADTGLSPGTSYWYRVRAKGSGNSYSDYSNKAVAATPATIVYVNFNHNVPPAPAPWNNTTAGPNFNISFPPLVNQDMVNTGIVLKIEKTFNGENNAGMNTGNNTGIVPDNVMRANYWLDKLQTSQIRVSGLNLKKKYSFGFIGSIGPNGWVANNYTATYSIEGRTVYLNSWQNTTKIVFLHDVAPSELGDVLINFSSTKDAAYGFNAGMVIFEYRPGDSVDYTPNSPIPIIPKNYLTEQLKNNRGEKPDDASVKVYPNPFTSELNLEFYNNDASNKVSAELYNVNGVLLYRKEFTLQRGNQRIVLYPVLSAGISQEALLLSFKINGKPVYNDKVIFKR